MAADVALLSTTLYNVSAANSTYTHTPIVSIYHAWCWYNHREQLGVQSLTQEDF